MQLTSKYIFILIFLTSIPLMLKAEEKEQEFQVQLRALNGSGVTGTAEIKIKNHKTLKIKLKANGLEANKLHPQHIHGLSDASRIATCPESSADVDGDGVISVGEGLPFYGPIVLPLNPFDLVGDKGKLRYKASYTINPASIQPLQNRTIVLHGMTVNGVYVPSLPIACGQIKREYK